MQAGTSDDKIKQVKARTWFYEFELPDGARTMTDLPADILPIHRSRRDKLTRVIQDRVGDAGSQTAADLASHEGYYSLELARRFASVRGYEIRQSSLAAARLITDALDVRNVEYVQADLQQTAFEPSMAVDFVLVYGLIYHLENPVHVLRLAARMSRQHILVETQVFPYDVSGQLEDGCYVNLRKVEGVFALTPDYSEMREGGSTDIALVPSLNGLLFLLRTFGFSELVVLPSDAGDYEQFRRGSRVVVYGRKTSG